ncbi:hypothetical protein [Micromonospora sp. WMMD710]|uniref:hypothetical protein n=1 Tax=Micromonospora sp. WMMD710 TaxID=3016085 RepID=UPI002416A5DC|nr:hypothetical protein [Micromonospora sp. WMMD710]MDG4757362.1 hypothetical protein [Micromonospora sp. WMMD710]
MRERGRETRQVPWRVLDELTPTAQQVGGVGRVRDELGVDHVVDLVRLQLQGRDDADVAAGATDGPEQVGMLLVVDAEQAAVRRDDLGGDDVVDGQAAPACQVSRNPAL